jgi:hypothetical protein
MGLFSPPAGGGDIVKPEALQGHLLIVRPLDFKADFPTSFGATDAVSADVVDLSEAGADGHPKVYKGAMFFNVMLVSGLKSEIGKMVLAVMTQGLAKPGQSAPWQLQDATQDEASVAAATAYLAAHPEFQNLAPPSPVRPAVAVAPVAVPPVAPVATAPVVPVAVPPVPVPVMAPYVPPVPTVTVSSTPAMTFAQVPAPGAAAVPGLPEGITPETLALIAKMQASGDLPGVNAGHA